MKKVPNYFKKEHVSYGLLEFDDEKCIRCGICNTACGGGSIIIPPKKDGEERELPHLYTPYPEITMCVACGDCAAACPNEAIKIKRGFTVKEPYLYYRIVQTSELTYPKKY
ncbi:MAG: 4Fe-4S dicluster domain-containing protein [Promethearchaeota archaeon]|nr:MAG: 4Fe-4S dicluster domain-containing protein [Candidatus Lokiarchaeota archaeon]